MEHSLYSPYMTDIEIIDKQYMRFFKLFDELEKSLRYNKADMDKFVMKFIEDMKYFTSEHFGTQKALMISSSYPNLNGHMKEHSGMCNCVFDIVTEYYTNDKFNPIETHKYLEEFIVNHIGKSDKDFFNFYKDCKNTLGFKIKEISYIHKKENKKNIAKI